MPDPFSNRPDTHEQPSRRARTVVPSDTVDYLTDAGQLVPKGLYVGGAGSLRVRFVDDTVPVDFLNVQPGFLLNGRVRRVLATGTTATAIVALC